MAFVVRIAYLPNNNGSPITDIEYQINAGAGVSLGNAALGDYVIPASLGDDVKIRPVNGVGAPDWSLVTAKKAGTAPVAATAPIINGEMEQDATVTITEGTYSGTTPISLTGTLTLDGMDVTADMVGLDYTIPTDAIEGDVLEWSETASNGVTPDATQTTSRVVSSTSQTVAQSLFNYQGADGLLVTPESDFFAGTDTSTPAAVDDKVGRWEDVSPVGSTITQDVASERAVLREANGNKYLEAEADSYFVTNHAVGESGTFAIRGETLTAADSGEAFLMGGRDGGFTSQNQARTAAYENISGRLEARIGDDTRVESSSVVNTPGTPRTIIVSWSDGTCRVYVDGVLETTQAYGGSPLSGVNIFLMRFSDGTGPIGGGAAKYWAFMSMNREISAQEASDLTNEWSVYV